MFPTLKRIDPAARNGEVQMPVTHGRKWMIDDITSTMKSEGAMSNDEWEKRQLCSDGNCIGVIGPDGCCKECGKPGQAGAPPVEVAAAVREDPAADEHAAAGVPADEDGSEEPGASGDDDDWDNRRLCPDGNCIGVIGPDGRCKECGRTAE